MTKEEAREFLESVDVCLVHYVRMVRKDTRYKPVCPKCKEDDEAEIERKIQQAANILRGVVQPHPAFIQWRNCENHLPQPNVKIELLCIGYRESGTAGGKNRYTINSQPRFWRPLNA